MSLCSHHNACQMNTRGCECSCLCTDGGNVGSSGKWQLGWVWPSVGAVGKGHTALGPRACGASLL